MSWSSLVTYRIDPTLKNLDKQMYSYICDRLNQHGFTSQDKDAPDVRNIFHLVVLPKEASKRSIKTTEDDLVFSLAEKNMQLFSTDMDKNSSFHEFLFYDEKEFQELVTLLELKIKSTVIDHKRQLIEQGHALLKKITRTQYLKKLEEENIDIKFLEEVESKLFQCLSLEKINEGLHSLTKSFKRKYSLMSAYKIYAMNETKFLLLSKSFAHWYFVIHEKDMRLLDLYIYRTVVSSSRRFSMKRTGSNLLEELEQIFSRFDIPIAVFDKNQHLVLHNAAFIDLNISAKNVLSLDVNDQLTINKEVYKVQKLFINDGEFIHINFIPVREFLGQSGKPSTEELGIVSSSIAHELNNPLGGILAALNVMELDEHDKQTFDRLDQMRKGVQRCQKLVQTFLGFSKISPTTYDKQLSVQDSFDQAMDLIRFRLIENNIVFNSEYFGKESFAHAFNPYIISMIFYLYLGELITSYSHQKLIGQKQSPKINLNFSETKDSLVLELVDDIKISSHFIQSKLITHLLETQSLQLVHDQRKCTFTYSEADGK